MSGDDRLIEEVARAICAGLDMDPDQPIRTGKMKTVQSGTAISQEEVTYPHWHDYRDDARKSIAAWRVLRDR